MESQLREPVFFIELAIQKALPPNSLAHAKIAVVAN